MGTEPLKIIEIYLAKVFSNAGIALGQLDVGQLALCLDEKMAFVDALKAQNQAEQLSDHDWEKIETSVLHTQRPRCLQLPLDSENGHISYLLYNLPPDFEHVDLVFGPPRLDQIVSIQSPRNFLKARNKIGKGRAFSEKDYRPSQQAIEDSSKFWEIQNTQKNTLSLHKGVLKLLQSPTAEDIDHGDTKYQVISYVANSQKLGQLHLKSKANQQDGIWFELDYADFFPYEPEPDSEKYHIYGRLSVESLACHYYQSGVRSLVVGIKFCAIEVLDSKGMLLKSLALTLEDIRELTNRLVKPVQRACHLVIPQQITLPVLPNALEQHKDKRDEWLSKKRAELARQGMVITAAELLKKGGKTFIIKRDKSYQFHLHGWLKSTLPEASLVSLFDRPMVYSQIKVGEDPRLSYPSKQLPYLKRLLMQLAEHKDHQYLTQPHGDIVQFGDPDIEHLVCRSGGVALINSNINQRQDRQYLDEFISNKGRYHYLGIMQLAYMQFTFLHGVDQQLMFERVDSNKSLARQYEELTVIYKSLLAFRVNDVFTDISTQYSHNQAYQSWAKAFSIPLLLQQLDKEAADSRSLLDTIYQQQKLEQHKNDEKRQREVAAQAEVEKKSHEARERAHEKSIKNIAAIGTAILFLTSVFGTNFIQMSDISGQHALSFFSLDWHLSLIGIVGLVMTFFLCYVNKTSHMKTLLSIPCMLISLFFIALGSIGMIERWQAPQQTSMDSPSIELNSIPVKSAIEQQAAPAFKSEPKAKNDLEQKAEPVPSAQTKIAPATGTSLTN